MFKDGNIVNACLTKNQNIIFFLLFTLLISIVVSLFILAEMVPLTFASNAGNSSFWTKGEKMPTARTEPMGVLVDDKIYVMGGIDYSKNYQFRKVEIYDTKTNQWNTAVKPMPQSLDHGAALAYNGKIYVPGGFARGKVPTDKLFIYDLKTKQWYGGNPLLSPRGALTAQIINGTLYVIGGVNASQVPVNTMEAYDLETGTWTTKKSMPTARHHLESAVVDGKLYVLGGRILGDGVASEDMEESLTNFNRVEVYDPQTDTWTTKKPMLEKRSGFAATSVNGQIYVVGGEGLEDTLASVEKYDPKIDKWSYEPSMPTGRVGLEAISLGDKIYVIGGQISGPKSGLISLDSNEIFNLKNEQGSDTAQTNNQ
jgi:N-acetylneuraminic acid mutarotase